MRKMKKIMALLITMVMVMAMATTAFATSGDGDGGTTPTESTTKSITLAGGKAGHTYTLYQIFTGTVEEGELTNIQWGSGITDDFKETKTTAAAYAKEIAEDNDARATAQSLITADALCSGTPNELNADGDVVFSGLAEGYYIITDTNGNGGIVEGDYSSALIVNVVKDVKGTLKADKPTSQKKVDDKNDSNTSEDAVDWQDSADYDIGDAVPFQLKATTANNVTSYKKYHITFEDKQSAGLDAPEKYTITVLDTKLELDAKVGTTVTDSTENTKITAEVVTADSGNTFAIKVTFEPVEGATTLSAECNSTDILVEYTSVLNTSAKIGSEGNPNTSYIKYSSNPESSDDSEEGKTPEDKVIVFTYKTVIDKIDKEGKALAGAGFTLYKVKADYTLPEKGSATEKNAEIAANSESIVATYTMTADSTKTSFSFTGLDDGTYVLCETTTPDGFNTMDPIKVTVEATHDKESEEPTLLELKVSDPFSADKDAGNVTKTDGTEHARVSGEAYAEIVNNSGTELPETGGIGTTIFYVIGAILVLGAGILLVTKKRMGEK